jgi:hypothetical protein
MMSKGTTIFTAFLVALAFTVMPAFAFQPPVISLERVEVASIQPFFVKPRIGYKSEKEPGKVESYGYSSTMNVAYIFNIKNPNKEPVMLDELQFTTAFDGFDISTPMVYEDSWVPGGKTNQLRVVVTTEAFPTVVSLMVGAEHADRIKEMKTSAGALVGKWFKEIPDFSFPITISNGTAVFKDGKDKEVRVAFTGKFGSAKAPEKKEEKKEEKK